MDGMLSLHIYFIELILIIYMASKARLINTCRIIKTYNFVKHQRPLLSLCGFLLLHSIHEWSAWFVKAYPILIRTITKSLYENG